jgi:LPXTG-motif cell wall-anchored protein
VHRSVPFVGLVAALAAGVGVPAAQAQDAVRICLATADGSYVQLAVDRAQLDVYRNGRNLVPAPAGGCPPRVQAGTPPPETTTTEPVAPEVQRRRARERRAAERRALQRRRAVDRRRRAARARELPNTGFDAPAVAGTGIALLLLGAGLRLRTATLPF